MNRAVGRRAGQPIVVLVIIIVAWAGLRSILWQSPFLDILPCEIPSNAAPIIAGADSIDVDLSRPRAIKRGVAMRRSMPRLGYIAAPPYGHRGAGVDGEDAQPPSLRELLKSPTALLQQPASVLQELPNSLVEAKYGDKIAPDPEQLSIPATGNQSPSKHSNSRWSFDSWVFLRQDGGRGAGSGGGNNNAGPLPVTYGASQVGGVLRYQLTPRDNFAAKAYIRATKALIRGGGADIAAGLSARPIKALPISAQAEIRISRVGASTIVRPAALAVTEFPPVELPLKMKAEIYAQGGYIGGDFATPFADGQARVDRKVTSFDLATLRAGAGVWGGVQKGAARLDIGPSASVDMPIAGGSARLSIDYRHRIAGDANPPSGIAITLSTGF